MALRVIALGEEGREKLRLAILHLVAEANAGGEGGQPGCEWLCGYCHFLRVRHQLA
jgi:hypothetical protein